MWRDVSGTVGGGRNDRSNGSRIVVSSDKYGDEHVKMACVGRCRDGSGGGTSHWSLEMSGLRIKKECGDFKFHLGV